MLDIAFTVATLLISIALLLKTSETAMKSALKLSRFFGIGELSVGFILVAVATSLPELSVSVISATAGEGAIAAGNIFGSNISNILLILGAGAFLRGVKISNQNMKEIALLLLLTTIVSVYIVFNSYVQQQILGIVEGVVLLLIFGGYAYHTTIHKRNGKQQKAGKAIAKKEALQAFLLFSAGIAAVMIISGFVVDSAVRLATIAGLANSFIGATFIAVGTSLPELSIFLQSVSRKRYGLALGNIIGSNVVNLTLVLGTAAAINPIVVNVPIFVAALLFAVVANMALLYSAAVNKSMGRFGGAFFLLFYLVYLVVIFGLQASEF